MKIINVKNNPEFTEIAIKYFQKHWASDDSMMVYKDCIEHSINTKSPLPLWYLLMEGEVVIGCAGLITNDFISRMDLYPWICALYVEEKYRGNAYGSLLLEQAKRDSKAAGLEKVYLCTDHIGYYENYGFTYIGIGYHPWGDSSRIYASEV